MAYSVGESVTGTVSGVTDYGAFVRLPDGSTGMIHISKLSREYVSDIRNVIKKEDIVTATVISDKGGKIALSLIGDAPKRRERVRSLDSAERPPKDFEAMLSSFKSASEEKLAHYNQGRGSDKKRRR